MNIVRRSGQLYRKIHHIFFRVEWFIFRQVLIPVWSTFCHNALFTFSQLNLILSDGFCLYILHQGALRLANYSQLSTSVITKVKLLFPILSVVISDFRRAAAKTRRGLERTCREAVEDGTDPFSKLDLRLQTIWGVRYGLITMVATHLPHGSYHRYGALLGLLTTAYIGAPI